MLRREWGVKFHYIIGVPYLVRGKNQEPGYLHCKPFLQRERTRYLEDKSFRLFVTYCQRINS